MYINQFFLNGNLTFTWLA